MIKKAKNALIGLVVATVLFSTEFFNTTAHAGPPPLMLAKEYHSGVNLAEYWVSEKYDGVRAYWDGKQLISRGGITYHAPDFFLENFPSTPLDGELWLGRGQFEQLSGIVRHKKPEAKQWQQVRYMVFDLPKHSGTFDQRYQVLQKLLMGNTNPYIELVSQTRVDSEITLMAHLRNSVRRGAEGLMLHRGNSHYHNKRNDDLLKLKLVQDAEATVVQILPGKGKYQGMMGSLLVEMPSGIRFKIGSGFSDKDRTKPPAIGSMVTYQYNGFTRNGKPRFPRYLRIRKTLE